MKLRKLLAAAVVGAMLSSACDSCDSNLPTAPTVEDKPVPTEPAPPAAPPVAGRAARPGLVVADGNYFADGAGRFYPLGETLFWALRGWKFERERVKQNIDFVGRQGFDYIRVLGQVDWAGDLATDVRWPDYVEQLQGLIDYAYSQGLRTQLTLTGGGGDAAVMIAKTREAIAGREQKIMFLEVANEAEQNWRGSQGSISQAARELRSFFPGLVAPSRSLSSEQAKGWIESGAANLALFHFERDVTDARGIWRTVVQPWGAREQRWPQDHNEPCGPRSSVNQCEEALHLVMTRATGIVLGTTGYTLHNGAGIYGQARPEYGGRPANVFEVSGIEEAMRALRGLDRIIGSNASDGEFTRDGLGPHPLGADKFVEEGGRGIVRGYAVNRPDGFTQVLLGIKDYVTLTAREDYTLEFYDPMTGALVRGERVSKGQSIRIEPGPAVDQRGMGAYIVKGRR